MYNFEEVEKKWQKYWETEKTFKTDVWDFSKKKYYVLDMFPYPSGQGLHVGHPEGYAATDIIARMKRMQGYNVLHPMGFDSFGLPAEQYAIQTGNHPGAFTKKNIETFKKQLKMLGFSFDWDREVSTCDPDFYKWTQWIFKQLYIDGLANYVEMPVNWCEELGTVLANDEIIDGKSERGGYPVVRKNMKQWVVDIPKYAESLIDGLDEVDWPQSTKSIQKNWIGKSEGARVIFKVKDNNKTFEVFTTRCDTLFGVTYCVLAPEHEIIKTIVTDNYKEEVEDYINKCSIKSDIERTELNKEKTGVFTGAYAINPINGKEVPIFISDYVLLSYGTGAIMAVPAHDSRDYDFAKKFNLDIIPVISGGNISESAYEGDGIHINSEFLNGLNKEDAINKTIGWLEDNNFGSKDVKYKLREWIFARQRYWGEPIPIVHLENNKTYPLTDEELPLILPELEDYRPANNGQSPLSKATSWVNVEVNGIKGKRETTTMPGSAGSSWYWLRYLDPKNNNEIASKKLMEHWLPVDLYLGGAEHAVGHLLYSRFINKFLYDKGIVPVKEPFSKLIHQGMILGQNGEKMSKSKGNVVNPDDVVKKYGADVLRIYEMFMGPINDSKPWDPNGIEGCKRFIDRVWRLFVEDNKITNNPNLNLEKIYHRTVKKVSEDYENLNFNTAISQLMIFINAVYKEESLPLEYAEGFIKLLNPIAPFITEEIWQRVFKKNNTISYEEWPKYDLEKTKDSSFDLIVQINNKIQEMVSCEKGTPKEQLQDIALQLEKIQRKLEGKQILKIISVQDKLVNIIIEDNSK